MRALSLFTGIGGMDLGAIAAGIEIAAMVEFHPKRRELLAKRFPGVPLYTNVTQFDYEKEKSTIGAIDIVFGGFPCQPFSTAGKRKGTEDDRHLWPEMLRIIQSVRPAWVLGENVAGLVSMVESVREFGVEGEIRTRYETMYLETLCKELEKAGYQVQPLIVPAAGIGAPHKRDRLFLVGYAEGFKKRDDRVSENQSKRKAGGSGGYDAPDCHGFGFKDGVPEFGLDRASSGERRTELRDLPNRPIGSNSPGPDDWEHQREQEKGQPEESGISLVPSPDSNADQKLLEGLPRNEFGEGESNPFGHDGTPDWSRHWLEAAIRIHGVDDGLSTELDKDGRT